MEFEQWEPVYEAILADFGYGRAGDKRARDRLAELLDSSFDPGALDWRGQTVAIAGGADSIAEESERQLAADADVVVAASIAADRLRDHEIAVDCMVTDLDKNPETVVELTTAGTPVAVHAHGDNEAALDEWVPKLDHEFVLPTTQAAPADGVRNFGGFTDGDRAAFLADARGAAELVFPGWTFDDPTVDAEKAHKLRWAERLLYWLEHRREQQFTVLDGRRETLDSAGLPVE